jgi:ankyrin repeat protein
VTLVLGHTQADLDTALLEHCRTGDIAMARRTIAAGADMACGDWLNDTPLHVAITYGHKELIDMLVDTAMTQNRLRELVYSKTVDGLDCFDTAHKWGFPTVAIMLHAFVEQSRVIDKANEILKGGTSSVPMHLKVVMPVVFACCLHDWPRNKLVRLSE